MVVLHKSQSNDVVLTLTEKMVDFENLFVFTLTNDSTGEVKLFTAEDISTGTTRYNEFTWTEDASEDLSSAIVNLDAGQWTYRAYEVEDPSTVLADGLNGTETLLETGRAVVFGDDDDSIFYDQNDATDNVVFEG